MSNEKELLKQIQKLQRQRNDLLEAIEHQTHQLGKYSNVKLVAAKVRLEMEQDSRRMTGRQPVEV